MMAIHQVIAVSTFVVCAFGKECYWAYEKPSSPIYSNTLRPISPVYPKLYLKDGNWGSVKPDDCDTAVEIYRRPQVVKNSGQCTLSSNVEVAGCFPWTPDAAGSEEKFTNVPLFGQLHGQTQKLESASPDACEQYCGNYKFFGLRQENGETWCWCTSAEEMMRLDNMSDDEKKALSTNIDVYCSEQCKACSNTKTSCGSETHTLIYKRQPARNLLALDMSGSMQLEDRGAATAHVADAGDCKSGRVVPGLGCYSPFRITWGKRVLNCVLDHQRQLQKGNSVHRIANRIARPSANDDDDDNDDDGDANVSKELYGYQDKFTNETIYNEHGWNADGATYIWEYLYEKLKTESSNEVNNGKLEVVLFTDGQDTDSRMFFLGKAGFVNMANELAKEHNLYPRFRIVCLNGGATGCAGYRDFAISTGGSYANFDESASDEVNEIERQRFCGTSSATFTKIDAEGTAVGVKAEPDDAEEEESSVLGWLLPLLIAAGLLLCCCLFCLLRGKKKESDADKEDQFAAAPVSFAAVDDGFARIAPMAVDAKKSEPAGRESKRNKYQEDDNAAGTWSLKKKKKHRSTRMIEARDSASPDTVRKSSPLARSRHAKKPVKTSVIRE